MRKVFAVGMLLGLILVSTAMAQGGPNGLPGISNAYGKSLGEWSAAWWQWALKMPATAHPLFDTAACSAGQTGHVWFLGGALCASSAQAGCADPMHVLLERTCAVPPGTALFFPVLNGEDSLIEEAGYGNPNATEDYLRQTIKGWTNPTPGLFKVTASVDGRPVNIERVCNTGNACLPKESPLFSFTLPSHDNILAAIGEAWVENGKTSAAVSDGFYVLIPPLPAGLHTISFYGMNNNFSLDITYHIVVGQ